MADATAAAAAEVAEFPLGFETVWGAFRGQCRLSATGLTLLYGSDVHLTVEWPHVHAADGGFLHPYQPNKVALDVTPTGATKPLLLKLYIDQLSEVETLVRFLSKYTPVRLWPGHINSLLHTPSLLPFYSHPLRRLLWAVKQVYGIVLKLALILYVTNLVAVLPDCSPRDVLSAAHSGLWYFARAPMLHRVGLVFLLPFFAPPLLASIPLLSALVAARHCVTLLLSLAFLQDIHHVLRLYREVVRFLAHLRSLAAIKRSEKKFQ
eukprot:GGOE01061344.1.p1 GENE.GGOE01061344.1~~GGOE01061344.1.p1  ORF type:complete len:264 (+),score=79.80 GGOE01061344.1:105-896(+)